MCSELNSSEKSRGLLRFGSRTTEEFSRLSGFLGEFLLKPTIRCQSTEKKLPKTAETVQVRASDPSKNGHS